MVEPSPRDTGGDTVCSTVRKICSKYTHCRLEILYQTLFLQALQSLLEPTLTRPTFRLRAKYWRATQSFIELVEIGFCDW